MRFYETYGKLKNISLSELLQKKPEFAMRCKALPIKLLFVFGSLAKEKLKPLSDIDIAVLFETSYQFEDMSKLRAELEKLIGREDIDLAVLNTGSPLLAMQVLHTGKLLYAESERTFKQFRFQTYQKYLASKDLRNNFFALAKRAILRKV